MRPNPWWQSELLKPILRWNIFSYSFHGFYMLLRCLHVLTQKVIKVVEKVARCCKYSYPLPKLQTRDWPCAFWTFSISWRDCHETSWNISVIKQPKYTKIIQNPYAYTSQQISPQQALAGTTFNFSSGISSWRTASTNRTPREKANMIKDVYHIGSTCLRVREDFSAMPVQECLRLGPPVAQTAYQRCPPWFHTPKKADVAERKRSSSKRCHPTLPAELPGSNSFSIFSSKPVRGLPRHPWCNVKTKPDFLWRIFKVEKRLQRWKECGQSSYSKCTPKDILFMRCVSRWYLNSVLFVLKTPSRRK